VIGYEKSDISIVSHGNDNPGNWKGGFYMFWC